MKHAALTLALALAATPAFAQLPGGLGKRIGQAQDAKKKADSVADLRFSEQEERQLGEHISGLLAAQFGVHQDAAVTKYVTLVGSVLAQASSRPGLQWQFIVLDTDGVNAYAAPGGLLHITRGALGLIRTEAELAGVLGHEIAHVTEKHTINAIQKSKITGLGTDFAARKAGGSGLTAEALNVFGDAGYKVLFENKFDRGDEMESDKVGIGLANKAGYAPNGMIGFLNKVSERNKGSEEPNGLFASHPQTADRISAMEKTIGRDNLRATATVAARYTGRINWTAKPASAIAMDIAGVKGAVGDSPAKPAAKDTTKEPDSKKGSLMKGFGLTKKPQADNTQTVASAGSRGGVPDRDAPGGSNTNRVKVTVTPAEIAEFKKGIA